MESGYPMEVEAMCQNGHSQRAILYTFVDPDGDGIQITGYFDTRCESCGGELTYRSADDTTARTAREVYSRTEDELLTEDYDEFEAVNRIVDLNDQRIKISGGEAIRRTNKKDETDVLTTIYPLDYGYRITHYRIDITGDEDRLVRRAVYETVRPD